MGRLRSQGERGRQYTLSTLPTTTTITLLTTITLSSINNIIPISITLLSHPTTVITVISNTDVVVISKWLTLLWLLLLRLLLLLLLSDPGLVDGLNGLAHLIGQGRGGQNRVRGGLGEGYGRI